MSASNPPLSPEKIEDRLEDLPGWVVNASGKLLCEFQFPDFRAAFRFMTLAADRAEELTTTRSGSTFTIAFVWNSPPTMPEALPSWTSRWRLL